METLDGHWKVRRERGVLPPYGIHKVIDGDRGWTKLGPIPLAPFKVRGTELRYRLFPLHDELDLMDDGTWLGRGYVFGKQYCEFRMKPDGEAHSRVTARSTRSERASSSWSASGNDVP